MPRKTATTDDAVREIAALQQKLADLINDAACKAERLEIAIAEKTDALRRAIEADRRGHTASTVAQSLAEHRVNVGELCSRFSDALERRGHTVFPHRYEPIRAEWALVTNMNRD